MGIRLKMSVPWPRLPRAASFVLEPDRVMIDGDDVTSAIRTPEVDVGAATVARMAAVRAALVAAAA